MLTREACGTSMKTIGHSPLASAGTTSDFSLLGSFDCLTQDVLSHSLKSYLDRRSLWRSERQHFWVESNFPLVRESGVLSVATAL